MAISLGLGDVRAATLTWSAATTIVGDTDVSTNGTLASAWDLGGVASTVNGVAFAATSSSISAGGTAYGGFGSSSSPFSGLSSAYQTLLKNGRFGAGGTVTLSGLVVGHGYTVQVWANDSRAYLASSAYDAVTSGVNSVQLHPNTTGAGGGVGQYTIGTFTADATTQTFTASGVGYPSADTYLTAIQLRDQGLPAVASAPSYSPVAGTYYGAQTVSVSSDVGARIFYTTDGTVPGSGSSNGISPVTVVVPLGVTRTITAYATNSGVANSLTNSAAYTTLSPIAWGPATTITGDSDVITNGNGLSAYSFNNGGGAVNGVTFANGNNATTLDSYISISAAGTDYTFGTPGVGGTAYQALVAAGRFGVGGATITLGSLTLGHQYQVQFWVNDSRGVIVSGAYVTLATGTASVNLLINTTHAAGGVGQYVVGTFTADTASKPFKVTGSWGDCYINAIQLRDLGVVVPTPAFNPAAGLYVGTTNVVITSESGSTVFYTTDGSTPTSASANGGVGTGSATVSLFAPTNMTINAYATNSAKTDSTMASANYNILSAAPTRPTWINTAGGSWPTAGNWYGGTVGTNTDVTADFGELTLPANTTVTLDGARTIGNLVFDDQGATKHTWTLNTGTGGPLTLAVSSGAPVISNNAPVTINAVLAGVAGLTKNGTNTLALGGVNTYTGGTIVNDGTLTLSVSGGTLDLLTINSGGQVNDSGWGLGAAPPCVSSIVINGGVLSYNSPGNPGGTAATNITMTGGSITNYNFDWYNGITSTPTLTTLPSSTTATISSGFNLRLGAGNNVTINVAAGTVPSGVDLLVSGIIKNTGGGGIIKTGAGLLDLNGANTYTGPTTVSGGTLLMDTFGLLNASSIVTVQTNGTLAGVGEVDGPTTIQAGGTLAPGGTSTNLGNLYVLNTLTTSAGGTNVFRISKNNNLPANDTVTLGAHSVTYGGTLVVRDITSDGSLLADGDTFPLFSSASSSYLGGYTTTVLPTLPAGLYWDTSGLTNGSIAVTSVGVPTATPSFTPPAGGYVGAQSVTIGCATPSAVIHYSFDGTTWTVYSGPIGVSASTNLTLSAYAQAPGYALSATNSATYTTEPAAIWVSDLSDSWANASNWTNGIIPNASGITADFSTVPMSSDHIVTLDGAQTLGHLILGEAETNGYGWEIDTGSGGPLTLAGATPTITALNGTNTIGAVLAGNSGITKNGNGTLVLNTSPTCIGPVTVSGGTLSVASGVTLPGTTTLSVSNGAALDLNGTGTPAFSGSVASWTIAGTVDLITASGTVGASAVFPYPGAITLNGGTLTGDAIDNSVGNLHLVGLFGENFPVIANGTGNVISCHSIGGDGGNTFYTLTLNTPLAGDTLAISSMIKNGVSSGGLPIHVTKAGLGVLTLSGTNTYTGATTVSNGTLVVNGAIGASAVTVAAGATLGGSGTINGAVSVNAGGALATAPGGISTLTINNSLGLAGNVNLRINSGTLTNDMVQGVSTLTYGGTLTVNDLGSALSAGMTFQLFNATTYAGNFAATNLPALGANLVWNWMPASGTLMVASSSLTPPILSGSGTLSGTTFQLNFSGPSGQTYKVLASTNVTAAMSNWMVLSSGTFGGSPVTYYDAGATNAQRFYRIVSP